MIEYVTGDATRPHGDGPKIIAHIVNDEGKWGRGFVVALSERDPLPEFEYRQWARNGSYVRSDLRSFPFKLGQIQLTRYHAAPTRDDAWVANMIAQHGIRRTPLQPRAVDYDALLHCLHRVAILAAHMKASVHMPRIGCDLGGGTWDQIEPLITATLTARDVPVTVYDLAEPKSGFDPDKS